jgi:hypothetical protein
MRKLEVYTKEDFVAAARRHGVKTAYVAHAEENNGSDRYPVCVYATCQDDAGDWLIECRTVVGYVVREALRGSGDARNAAYIAYRAKQLAGLWQGFLNHSEDFEIRAGRLV